MNVRDSRPANEPGTVREAVEPNAEIRGERVEVSTRVLLNSPSLPECHACGDVIERGTRHKCLTVRDSATVRELLFCADACLDDATAHLE